MNMRRSRALLTGLVLCGFAGAPAGRAQAQEAPASARCTPITTEQVDALFDRWNAALATGNPDAVVSNYAPDAVLLPTAQNGPMIGREAIRDYFVYFLKQHPHGTVVHQTVRIGCNMVYDVGVYKFTVDGKEPGSREKLAARYTYIYEPRDGQWLIVHHHSSAMPQPQP